MKPRSLRMRMTAAFAVAFAAMILIFMSFTLWFSRRTAEQGADAALLFAANKLRTEYPELQPERGNSGWSDEPGEWTTQNLALVVVGAKGAVLFKTPGQVPAWPRPDRQIWRIQTVALGDKTAILGYHWQKTEGALRSQAVMLIGLCVALLLAATLGAWLLVGRTLSPIYRLSRQVDAASLDGLRVHLIAPSQDAEIVHLVGTLNALMERLAGAISARERFYAAASHELRTPLQTLKGVLELALMRDRGAKEYRAALAEAYSQSERLASLVQALLLLNQLESTPVIERQEVDLSDACKRWIEEYTPLAESRRLRFTLCPSEGVFVLASPSHVDILLRNLVENAVKYAAPHTEIQVCIRETSNETVLSIFNLCLTVPEWNEEKLFEPFYRPDASRNSDTGGNGLGLAICKGVAVANGWGITLEREGTGVQARVTFR